jgi:hypothetical protein
MNIRLLIDKSDQSITKWKIATNRNYRDSTGYYSVDELLGCQRQHRKPASLAALPHLKSAFATASNSPIAKEFGHVQQDHNSPSSPS